MSKSENESADPNGSAVQPESKVDPAVDNQTENPEDENVGALFQILVKLPHEPFKIQVMVTTQEQVQDLRQSIVELPGTFQYTNFHLEHNGARINDYVELSEVEGLQADSEVTLVEDPYTEKEARMHVLRIRELVGAAGNRVDTLYGISAGLSLHDDVAAEGGQLPSNGPNDKESKNKDTEKGKDHALATYDVESAPSLKTILPRESANFAPKTVRSISLSQWNPPPYHLRQKGHLLYLSVTTNEGEQFQITADVRGFFVNKSSNSKFDPFPRPAPKNYQAHSLLTLLGLISPSFESQFKALQEFNNTKDLLTTFPFQNAIPSSSWLVPQPSSSSHQADITRTQENHLIAGVDNAETLRDWNEEFQSTRELARENVQDKVFRERLTSKLFADYNDAAARGAVLVARGEVASLNPTEPLDAQIFVYNNIFFSFGVDGVGTFASEGGDEAARAAVGKDVLGVKTVNQLDIDGLFTPGTVVVDYLGKRIVAQSIVPGIFKQREPGESQIDYGGAEGREVITENPAFVDVFEKLSSALRVKKHPVWDKDGKRHDLEGSVETKGLLGTDGRKYVLDLYRITPLDVAWLEDKSKKEYPHRMVVLRLELVDAFFRHKMTQYVKEQIEKNKASKSEKAQQSAKSEKSEKDQKDEASEDSEENANENEEKEQRVDLSGFKFSLNPDVFSGQTPQTEEEKAAWVEDETEVRAACGFLLTNVIPEVISDIKEGDVNFPMDGASLSQLLHKRGINIRYLGKIASLAQEKGQRLEVLKDLCIQEMITRSFKHVASHYLCKVAPVFISDAVAHLLNCFLGTGVNENPKVELDQELKALYSESDFTFETLTAAKLLEEVKEGVSVRFRYELADDWVKSLKHLQVLRSVALKFGLQIGERAFEFNKENIPVAAVPSGTVDGTQQRASDEESPKKKNKKRKNKSKSAASPTVTSSSSSREVTTFTPDDIMNAVPRIKDAAPRCALAEEALDAGRISLMRNQKALGQELILESLTLHEQIYGILHPEVAKVYHQLSMLYYQSDEKDAAVELARKAVIVTERIVGVDTADTVLAYLNLSLFEHAQGNTKLALTYIKHAMDIGKIIFGTAHPDSITTMNNAAVMLQHLKSYADSRKWFEASLPLCQSVFGERSINTATISFQLAQALALDQESKAAVSKMREAYNIFKSELGEEDRNTKEAEMWLEQLTQNAVNIAKHAKDLQARKLRRVNANPSLPGASKKMTPAAVARG